MNGEDSRASHIAAGLRQASGPVALARMLRMRANRRLPARWQLHDAPIGIALRELGGDELFLRPGTSDIEMMIYDYAYGFHLPPEPLRSRELRSICELGSNAGAALASYAHRYPQARVVGVEPDPANVEVGRRNIERYGERVELVRAGIWSHRTELTIEGTTTHGGVVRERTPDDGPELPTIPALSFPDVLDDYFPGGELDFLYVSIEGAERHLLDVDADWPARVHAIRVEVQGDKGFWDDECVALLEAMGYRCTVFPELGGSVFGTRD